MWLLSSRRYWKINSGRGISGGRVDQCCRTVVGGWSDLWRGKGRRTPATATFRPWISLSSLSCWRRWAGRHGGFVGWAMIVLNVEKRWTRWNTDHGWDGVGFLWSRSHPGHRLMSLKSGSRVWRRRRLLVNYGPDLDGKDHRWTGREKQNPWWGELKMFAHAKVWLCFLLNMRANEYESEWIWERSRGEGQVVIYRNVEVGAVESWSCSWNFTN